MHLSLLDEVVMSLTFEEKRQRNGNRLVTFSSLTILATWDQKQHARLFGK